LSVLQTASVWTELGEANAYGGKGHKQTQVVFFSRLWGDGGLVHRLLRRN
jgi:hypothetical protein